MMISILMMMMTLIGEEEEGNHLEIRCNNKNQQKGRYSIIMVKQNTA